MIPAHKADPAQTATLDAEHLAELALLETQQPGFCRMLHERFLESFCQGCTEMIKALHSSQRQTQINLAHRLSGSAASFGAAALAGQLKTLESRLRQGEEINAEQIEIMCAAAEGVGQAFLGWLETQAAAAPTSQTDT